MKIERLSLRAKPALKDQRTHSPDLPDVLEFQLERLIPRLRLEHQAPRRLKGMSWFACWRTLSAKRWPTQPVVDASHFGRLSFSFGPHVGGGSGEPSQDFRSDTYG
jgi:hypothetical protein